MTEPFFFAKSQTRNWDKIVRGGLLTPNFSTKLNKIKMQKTLTTTALVFAGVSGLMAADNIDDGISGYHYTDNAVSGFLMLIPKDTTQLLT